MKIFRITVILLFLISLGVSVGLYFQLHSTVDMTVPVITMESDTVIFKPNELREAAEMLVYSKYSPGEKAYEGLTAYDEKDGDITNQIFIESVSKFTEPGVCKATYSVCDNDNHIAKVTRKIVFEGYKSPEFRLDNDLVFTTLEPIDLSQIVGAEDVIQGDITSNVIVSVDEFAAGTAGTYTVHAEATNDYGDVSTIDFPLILEERDAGAPVIELNTYLIYLKKGSNFSPRSLVTSATDKNGDTINSVTYKTNLNPNAEGLYTVDYYATDERGLKGHSALLVIVK